jgi:hypothetical protein
MENPELNKLLKQLHDEINNTQAVDEQGKELLRDLDEDLHTLLARNGGEADDLSLQRVDKVIRHFEATHPSLTVLISKFLDTLNNAGI